MLTLQFTKDLNSRSPQVLLEIIPWVLQVPKKATVASIPFLMLSFGHVGWYLVFFTRVKGGVA